MIYFDRQPSTRLQLVPSEAHVVHAASRILPPIWPGWSINGWSATAKWAKKTKGTEVPWVGSVAQS